MINRSGILIEPLARDDAAAFDAVFAICASVIERSEQKTEAELHVTFVREDYVFLAAKRDGLIVGFASLFMPAGEMFWLLEYLAVAQVAQGQGLGAALFAASVAHAGRDRIGLLEVDAMPPADAGSERRGEVGRRLAFYDRLGCRQVAGVDYVLPLKSFGAPPPMVVLAHAPADVESVARGTLHGWLRTIYVEVYGQAPDDSRVARMVDKLDAEIWLLEL